MYPRNREIEKDIFEYVNHYIEKNNAYPSYRDIAAAVGIRSIGTISRYLKRMEESGMLDLNGRHGVSTKRQRMDFVSVPIVGNIACGLPNFAEEQISEYVPILRSFLGSGEFFALYACGDSMIGAGIDDGDLVFVRKTNIAYDGDIVVALIDDSATLKRYYNDTERRCIVLHPENPKYKDMEFEDIVIQGVAVKVLKSL